MVSNMSDSVALSHIDGYSMEGEQGTMVQFIQSDSMKTGLSDDFQEFSFASQDGCPVPNLVDISPSISWSVFSTTGHNITDIDMEQIIDIYRTTDRHFALHHENESVSNVITILPSIPQPVVSTHMNDEIQTNLEEKDYPETEQPFTAHDGRYPMSNLTGNFPSTQWSVGSTPTLTEMQTNFGEIDNYHQMERLSESHNANLFEGSPSVFHPMASTSTYNQSLTQNETKIISAKEETTSNRRQKETKPFCIASIQQNLSFSSSPVFPFFEQQSEYSGDISSAYQPEQHHLNSTEWLTLQDSGNIQCTEQDASDCERSSFEELIDADGASTSFGNLCASAGPSDGWDLIEQCEPLGAKAHRRPQDRCFVCPACEKICRWWNDFCTHFRTHTGERPYPCNFCDKKFNTQSNLTVHLRIHSGEKPYQCDMCVKKFYQKCDLNRHRRTHTEV